MVPQAPEYLVGGVNADAMPRDRRVDLWREHVTANHGALRFTFSDPRDFHGGTRVQRAGPVQLVDFWSDAIGYERRSADIDRDGVHSAFRTLARRFAPEEAEAVLYQGAIF